MTFLLHSTSFNTHYIKALHSQCFRLTLSQSCCMTCNRYISLWQKGRVNVLMGGGIDFFLIFPNMFCSWQRKPVTGIWNYFGIELLFRNRGLLKYFCLNYMLMLHTVNFHNKNIYIFFYPNNVLTSLEISFSAVCDQLLCHLGKFSLLWCKMGNQQYKKDKHRS